MPRLGAKTVLIVFHMFMNRVITDDSLDITVAMPYYLLI